MYTWELKHSACYSYYLLDCGLITLELRELDKKTYLLEVRRYGRLGLKEIFLANDMDTAKVIAISISKNYFTESIFSLTEILNSIKVDTSREKIMHLCKNCDEYNPETKCENLKLCTKAYESGLHKD